MENELENKLIFEIDRNLDILISDCALQIKDQKKSFYDLRRSSLSKNSTTYLTDGSFYNYKQTDKKLKMLSGMKQIINELRRVKYVK